MHSDISVSLGGGEAIMAGGGLYQVSESPKEDQALLLVLVDYLGNSDVDEFRAGCLKLLQTGRGHLVIDLRSLRKIPSGVLAAVIDVGLLSRVGRGSAGCVTVMAHTEIAEQFRLFTNSEVLSVHNEDSAHGIPAARRRATEDHLA